MNVRLLARRLKYAAILFVLPFFVNAQQKTVTGKVTSDKDGSAISGATVIAKGSTKGTQTSADGAFVIEVPAATKKLVVSSVGNATQEVSIGIDNTANVVLKSGGEGLTEVVVIGYGTSRKKDLTGSVVSVKAKDFNQGFVTSPDQLLQNKVSGLEITNNSGQPGVATTIKIRGNNSIRAVNNPLYVIDGVPLDGRTARPSVSLPGFGATPETNPLLYINPNDIAQIEVLKDAASAAIYGARGANGVIVITTKKGSASGTKLEFGTSFGTSAGYMHKYQILNAAEFRSNLTKYGLPASLDKGQTVDALKEITQSNLSSDYNLSLSSGNENGKVRASFLASRARGFIKNSGLEKYLASLGGQYKFLDSKLSLDFDLRIGNTKEIVNIGNTAGSEGGLIPAALSWNPTVAFKDNNDQYITGTGYGNPLALLKAYSDVAKVNSVLADISASYKLMKNLSYTFLFAINNGTGERNTNVDGWIQGFAGISGSGLGVKSFSKLSTQTITHYLNYNTDFSSKLRFEALAGYEYWKTDFSGSSFRASGFNTNLTQATITNVKYTDILNDGSSQAPPSTFVNPTSELQSFFGRVKFNLSDKYLLSATLRADGSSKFGKNNKYGYFPSVAARWNINNEDFMKGNSIFSSLALRASWGITGNQEFPAGSSQEQFGFNSNNNPAQFGVANPNLKWESTRSFNVGLDYATKGGKIYGSLDYYDKNTTDILFQSTAIQPAPSTTYFINLPANLNNKGVEFSIGAAVIDKKSFGLDVNFNISNNKNLLTKFFSPGTTTPLVVETGQINGQGVSGTLAQRITNDQPVNIFYLKQFNGFVNGKQQIGDDPVYAGDPNPHTIYGFGANIRYKKFTATLNAGGAAGFLIYNNTATNITNLSGLAQGRNVDLASTKTEELTTSDAKASTRFLEKGNYLKLRNLSIRYAFGNVGSYLKGVNVFVSGSNLFVITKFTGFDPEVNIDKSSNNYPSRSIEYIPYPTPRTITFGFNLSL
jgi:TonB-dependent starch-binding outer membrane protein SusC